MYSHYSSGRTLRHTLAVVSLLFALQLPLVTLVFAEVSDEPTTVQSGDASNETDIVNGVNQNDIDASGAATTTVTTESSGTVDNTLEQEAMTGENSASSTGTVSIGTGNAVSSANMVNVVNANIIDSTGFIILLNRLFGGTLDLSNIFNTMSPHQSDACTILACAGEGTTFNGNASSSASISNDVVVRAQTGGNSATSSASASVSTGNAYAGANVVNVANLNAVDSNYLLISINNFGDLLGDIILPGLEFFASAGAHSTGSTSSLEAGSGQGGGAVAGAGDSIAVATNNSATVNNGIDLTADTGNNTASTTNGASITTGNAGTGAGVTNQINTNLFGGQTVRLLFRVFGDWSGKIFGLPPGLQWEQTANGIEIFSSTPGSGSLPASSFNFNSTSTASINNNITVTALTGDNQINASEGDITTGNAFAAANVINVANTNIIGQNWIYAIFNIGGNWNGNLSFGQPNLWIGSSASGPITPGSRAALTFVLQNRGHSIASNVQLKLTYNHALLALDDASDTSAEWNVGSIAPGASITVTREGTISANVPEGATSLPIIATVTPDQLDANMDDNTDRLDLVIQNGASDSTLVTLTPDDDLRITKTASASTVQAGQSVEYYVHIENKGGPAYHSQLFDYIKDEGGEIISKRTWWLDVIDAGEVIDVKYSVTFASSTAAGLYTNEAQVKAIDRHPSLNPFYGWYGFSPIASTTVEVTPAPVESMELLCQQYLNSYIGRMYPQNDPVQVKRLQAFLKGWEMMDVPQTGVFDDATYDAVVTFQEKYGVDVLDPWGINKGTGHVYYTTRKKVNDLFCKSVNETIFPLSAEQQAEIATFKASGGNKPNVPTVGANGQITARKTTPTLAVPKAPTSSLLFVKKTTPKVPNTGAQSQTAGAASSSFFDSVKKSLIDLVR